jgi:catechol 2,3-dioxygenase-like lactoylglutathione lyase family enzyme
VNVDAITLFVEDRLRSKEFYERALGREAIHEDEDSVAFRLDNLVLNLLVERAAHELVEPAPVGGAGARFQLTVGVEDVDAACADLRGRGIALLNGPLDRPWGIRTAAFADPDGHVWELAAPLR